MLNSRYIKKLAADVGFNLCGITHCKHFSDNEQYYRQWLEKGYNANLWYLEDNLDKRFDVRQLVEGAQTVVVCAVSYKNEISEGYPEGSTSKIASYACNKDYHSSIKVMLHTIFDALIMANPDLHGRVFVDSAPLLEKQLAVEAGLGWIGRQSLLVTPQLGSFVLLGELVLTDKADIYDQPFSGSHCDACHRCMERCPTQAIVCDKQIDATRCIACRTIESELMEDHNLHGWIFGCDMCQSCCPYNQSAPKYTSRAFQPAFDPRTISREEWLSMTEDTFAARFGNTPLGRSGLGHIKRNITGYGKAQSQ